MLARETKVGIPLEKEEDQWSSSSDDDDDSVLVHSKQDGQTSPQPSTGKDSNDSSAPTSLEYYGFELKDPSPEDMRMYNRLPIYIVYHLYIYSMISSFILL